MCRSVCRASDYRPEGYQFKSGHVHLLYFAHENNDYSIHFCIFALWTFALDAWHLGDPYIDPPVYVSIIMATVLVWNDIARILVCTDSRSWSWYWSYVLLSFQEDGGECFVNVVEFSFVPSHCLTWLSHLSVSSHSFLYSPWLLMLRLSVAAITNLWTSRWSFAYSICTPHGRDMRAVCSGCEMSFCIKSNEEGSVVAQEDCVLGRRIPVSIVRCIFWWRVYQIVRYKIQVRRFCWFITALFCCTVCCTVCATQGRANH